MGLPRWTYLWSNNLVSAPLWAANWPPRNPVLPCSYRTPQRGMDKSPTDGGLRLGGGAMLFDPRSGQGLWRGLHPGPSLDGDPRRAHIVPIALAERLL
jgi:hypothetical protein